MDVVVPEEQVARAVEALATLGYEHRGDLGIPGREAMRPPTGALRHHLYVCADGCAALANHLAVRDHLREHPEDAGAYASLKRRLAQAHPDDRDAYVAGKTAFLLGVLRRRGLPEATLAEVEAANRPRPTA